MTTISTLPTIALLLGDPAGIGPELAARLLSRPKTLERANVVVLADAEEYDQAFKDAGLPSVPVSDVPRPGHVVLLDDRSAPVDPIPLQKVSMEAGQRVMHQLVRAVELAKAGEIEGIVFMPLNKTSLHLAGMDEKDELRWFAKRLGYKGTTSELNVLDQLWTARVTSHIAMSDVAARITKEAVTATIQLLHDVLRDSGLEQPRLGVCALNPHGGENGSFGREEIDQIRPGIDAARNLGIDATGPFPSDTIFIAARRGTFDGVVTMYHDQGQIAMKLMGFDKGVSIQGGLPIAIATPAHGTAFDIVGKRVANLGSSENAFDIAISIASRRLQSQAAQIPQTV